MRRHLRNQSGRIVKSLKVTDFESCGLKPHMGMYALRGPLCLQNVTPLSQTPVSWKLSKQSKTRQIQIAHTIKKKQNKKTPLQ